MRLIIDDRVLLFISIIRCILNSLCDHNLNIICFPSELKLTKIGLITKVGIEETE